MLLSVNKVPKKLGTDTLNKVLDFAEKYLKLNPKLEIHIDFIRTKKFLGQYEGIDEHGETHFIDINETQSQVLRLIQVLVYQLLMNLRL